MSPEIGSTVELLSPLRKGRATLVAVIGRGSRPDPSQVALWYGDAAPPSSFVGLRFDRLIFKRIDTGGFIIIPDNPDIPRLYEVV